MSAGTPPVGFPTKLLYGMGSVAYGVKDLAFRSFLLFYYSQIVGWSAGLVAAAIFVALLVDAVSDPIVGQISDNLRTGWGRRHPLMYASALPAAGSFLLLWFPPDGLHSAPLQFLYLVAVASAVRTFITFYEIPSSALAPELSTDYHQRTSIASYRYFFAYAGAIVLAFITYRVFLAPTEQFPIGQLNPAGYVTFAMVGAVVMVVSVLISSMGTHHRIRYLRKLPPPERLGVFATLKQMVGTFAHRGFLSILAFGVLKYTAIGMTAALNIYFGTYFWRLNSSEMSILALDGLLGAGMALVMAPWAARRMGKRNAAFILAVIAVLFAISPFVLRFNGLFLPNGHPFLLPTLFVVVGIYAACGISSAILVHAMIGDVVDERALSTGRRSEGLFYAANTFMQKSVSGLGLLAAGTLLHVVQLPKRADPATLDPSIISNLALVYIPSVAGLYIVGASFLYFYRIDQARHEANLARLREQENPLAEEPGEPAAAGAYVHLSDESESEKK